MQRHSSTSRVGFTLIEMLAVMGILLVLATMVVGVSLTLWSRGENVHSGATAVQQAFKIAKSRAVANQRPVGIRLYTTNYLATELHFIEQPDDFTTGTILTIPAFQPPPYPGLAPNTTVTYEIPGNIITATLPLTTTFTGGLNDPLSWPVQPNDYLELNGGGLVHRIGTVNTNSVVLAEPYTYQIKVTQIDAMTQKSEVLNPLSAPQITSWRIQRSPRILLGETPIKLPVNVVIDTLTNTTYSNPLPYIGDANGNGQVDMLFTPSGRVLDQSNSSGSFLWVRRADSDDPRSGALVITIKYKTGWIAVNQIDANGTNPYSQADDPRMSGL